MTLKLDRNLTTCLSYFRSTVLYKTANLAGTLNFKNRGQFQIYNTTKLFLNEKRDIIY